MCCRYKLKPCDPENTTSHLFLLLEETLQLLLLGGQLALQVKAAQLQALGILHGQEHGVGGEMWGRVKCEKTRDE